MFPRFNPEGVKQLYEYEQNTLSQNSCRAYANDLKVFTSFIATREPSLFAEPKNASFVDCLWFLNGMANKGLTVATHALQEDRRKKATINRHWAYLRHHLIPTLADPEVEIQYRHVIACMRRKLQAGLSRGKKSIMEKGYSYTSEVVR